MTTLTKTAELTKKTVKYGIFGSVLLVIAIIGWRAYKSRPRPTPPPTPTCNFGKLLPLTFPPEEERPTLLTLETIQGGPPEGPVLEKVYAVTKKGPDILSGRRAQQFAQELHFSSRPIEKEPEKYSFADPEYPARSLSYNPVSDNFLLEFDLTEDPSPLEGDALPLDENRVIAEAQTIFQSLGKLNNELVGSRRSVSYFRFENNGFVEIQNKLQAQLVRVDFMRNPIDEKEIKTPQLRKSSVYILFSGKRKEQERVVKIHYQLFPAGTDTFGTYPLKSSQAAWEELQSGGGYVVNVGAGNKQEAIIRDAFLAYYDPGDFHQYLQPVFVFTGDRNFEAYVSAIPPEACE